MYKFLTWLNPWELCVFLWFNSLSSQLWHSHVISFNPPPIIQYREYVYRIWFYLGQYLCSSFNIYLLSVVSIIIHPLVQGSPNAFIKLGVMITFIQFGSCMVSYFSSNLRSIININSLIKVSLLGINFMITFSYK